MIPYTHRKKGIINLVSKFKREHGQKNDCWAIALSLATGWDYGDVVQTLTDLPGALCWRNDGTLNAGYDRRFCDAIGGIYTKEIIFTPKYVEDLTVERQVEMLDPTKKYILWCWRHKDPKDEGKGKFYHLMYSTGNEIWDDKLTRLGWFISQVYEVRSIKDE